MSALNTFFENNLTVIQEIFFIIVGLQLLYTAIRLLNDKACNKRIGSALFWGLIGLLFIIGPYIPYWISGVIITVIATLTLFNQVEIGTLSQVSDEVKVARHEKFGNTIFGPVFLLGITALIVSYLFPALSSAVVGIGALVAMTAMLLLVKPKPKEVLNESDRMVQQVSTTGILPQLLSAVGTIFAAAGVGEVIANIISSVIPNTSHLWGVIAYVLGMVIFTMIMGNAFAAFAVITVGVGVPFVFNAGGDPAIASALAMTAGFCGTLMTPMAGNFNALPAALLETKDSSSVIRMQIPFALIMVVAHIVLMYFWAF